MSQLEQLSITEPLQNQHHFHTASIPIYRRKHGEDWKGGVGRKWKERRGRKMGEEGKVREWTEV